MGIMEYHMNEALQKQFIRLVSRLEPENLTCDGECSRTQVRARLSAIRSEWRTLEKEAGRKVSEEEINKLWIDGICACR